ncbi:hypothetical protein AV530_005350 [Patagioenas fasciata monilis]|uniref:Uncharacterized protein n=1 Tax=Patagioenas fasciata monilis TaxID=372326 RepID=A0A1V4JKZ0_PATFA|nr:hypothetical protein AV530_005350 [Patagioenas fasciata monilis]
MDTWVCCHVHFTESSIERITKPCKDLSKTSEMVSLEGAVGTDREVASCYLPANHPCPDPETPCQGEGICPPSSWRQVELEITEANACRKGGVAACATHVYPVLIRLIVKDNA